ncbi:hypothetical protein Tco_0999815 [Tanacetum coccineum]
MSQKRAIITHDGKVYIFHTKINEVNAPATCLGLLFDDPLEPNPVAEGVEDYLDLKGASEITRMFPSRRTKDGFSDFNLQDLSSTYESYIPYNGKNKVVVPAAS